MSIPSERAEKTVSLIAGTKVFDRNYFKRYYEDPKTRVAATGHYAVLADFIAAYLRMLTVPVASILDAGAGVGHFRSRLLRRFPDARYLGIDVSEYACERYGWTQTSIADFSEGRYDLVVCHDVLQYLPAREAERALMNLAQLCGGVLYFVALTREDWRENCDQTRTDRAVFLRSVRWYAKRLEPHFRNAGGGLFIARQSGIVSFALHASP